MILTCPSCSASYNVPNDAIGVDGRTVRCKKCKHEWFQEGEKKALEDLINMIQATDIDLDELAFDDTKKKPKSIGPKPKEKSSASLKERLAVLFNKIIPPALKSYLFSGDNRGFLSHFASFMVALAVFSCLFLILVTGRWGITHALPSLASVYEAGGFPLANYARLNPEESLIIDRLALHGEGDKREITGSLINLTSQNIKVPTFKVAYMDNEGGVLQESIQNLPMHVIGKELSFNFTLTVPEAVPQNVSSVKISFTESTYH